jgi:DNA primase small subunit
MNVDTKIFLRKRFKEYYSRNEIPAPNDVGQREFGVGTLDTKIKVRHKSFGTERDMRNYLRREAPFYISYSSAYYEFPENQPMAAKKWLGADLVFDLDVDMDFMDSGKLEGVKAQAINLMDFMLSDFGFSEKDMGVNFSGSKGYHIHVFSDEVKSLGNKERREIVDYVTGSGFDLDMHLLKEALLGIDLKGRGDFQSRGSSTAVIRGPTREDIGWKKRAYDVALDFVSLDMGSLKRVYRVRQKTAEELCRNRELNLKLLESGRWDALVGFTENMKKSIIERYAVRLTGDADKMVTIDTSRLIRLPDSIHGGSGLVARRVGDICKFDPLTDALAFGDEKVKVDVREKIPEFDMNGQRFGKLKGVVEVPEYVGVYLLLKDKAEFVRD